MKRIKELFKNNLKLIIGIMIGAMISGIGVYAVAVASSSVSYDNTSSGSSATTVKEALDELYGKVPKSPTGCITPPFNEGDYIQLIPNSKSYVVSSSLTGYTSDQTINPSELTLWRVIKKNPCNVEVVSEYVSSTGVYFYGTTGYANFVGALNEIARQYINKYTTSARMMGYDGQTEYISDTSAFDGSTDTPPSTTPTLTPETGTGEEYSGGVLGDTLYLKDYLLVKNVYGNVIANIVGTTTVAAYWLSSRSFGYVSAPYWGFGGRIVLSSGSLAFYFFHHFNSGGWYDDANYSSVRPILTLKSGITTSGGSGTKDNPYTLN